MYLTKNLSRGAILTLDGHTLSEVLSPSVSGGDCGGIVKVGILSIIGEIALGACPTILPQGDPSPRHRKGHLSRKTPLVAFSFMAVMVP